MSHLSLEFYLAALTPKQHTVRVIHQQVEPPPLETDADIVAISFFSGFAPEAYALANYYRSKGITVIGGGPHVTFAEAEAKLHFDPIVIGEVESTWSILLQDFEKKELKQVYRGTPINLLETPTPRYELMSNKFFIQRVVQATRGCPFNCSFCTVPSLNPGFRVRPIEKVLADIQYDNFKYWWQRKIVWFWDDNLTANHGYVKDLLKLMKPLKKWWLTQASMDISKDENLLLLMKQSGCIGVFFGIESFKSESLQDAGKSQNKSNLYSYAIQKLHNKGICVMAGIICGFDNDTPASIKEMAKQLYEAGVDVPFISVLTPFQGTKDYANFLNDGRILLERGWEFYNGYNVTFIPKNMTPDELLSAHRELWKEAFSIKYSFLRVARSIKYLNIGAFLMCLFMNTFYCIKRIRGNIPIDFGEATNHA